MTIENELTEEELKIKTDENELTEEELKIKTDIREKIYYILDVAKVPAEHIVSDIDTLTQIYFRGFLHILQAKHAIGDFEIKLKRPPALVSAHKSPVTDDSAAVTHLEEMEKFFVHPETGQYTTVSQMIIDELNDMLEGH